jgi:ABC-type glycerol-3-phosphate transport system substrate-binding protein
LYALTFAALIILSACGGGNENTDSDTSPDETSQSEGTGDTDNTPEQSGSTVDKSAIKGEVKVVSVWGASLKDQYNNFFADFNKEFPNIKVTYMDQSTWELAALIAAGEAPDIILADGGRAPELLRDNMVIDLRPFIETDPDVNPDIFYEPAFNRGTTASGMVWQLPWQVDPNFPLVYNPNILDQYGYTEIPETNSLDELGNFLREFWIVENGKQVMTTYSPFEIYGAFNSLITMSYLNGADSSTYYDPANNTVKFNDPIALETLEWMLRFKRENIDDDRMNELNSTLPEGTNRFSAEKQLAAPMVISDFRNYYQLNPDLQYTLMPPESLWIGGHGVSMSATVQEENKEAAWQVLKWMTSTKEGAASKLEHFALVAGIKDNPRLLELTETDLTMKAAYEVLQNAKKLPPFIPVEYNSEFEAKWAEVLAGTLEPKAFLDHMTSYTQKLLDEQAAQ